MAQAPEAASPVLVAPASKEAESPAPEDTAALDDLIYSKTFELFTNAWEEDFKDNAVARGASDGVGKTSSQSPEVLSRSALAEKLAELLRHHGQGEPWRRTPEAAVLPAPTTTTLYVAADALMTGRRSKNHHSPYVDESAYVDVSSEEESRVGLHSLVSRDAPPSAPASAAPSKATDVAVSEPLSPRREAGVSAVCPPCCEPGFGLPAPPPPLAGAQVPLATARSHDAHTTLKLPPWLLTALQRCPARPSPQVLQALTAYCWAAYHQHAIENHDRQRRAWLDKLHRGASTQPETEGRDQS